jgi:hypothetical protein
MVGTTQGDFDNSQTQTGTDAIVGVIASDGSAFDWRAHLASDQFAYDAFTEVTIGPNDNLYAVGETEGSFIGNAQASNDQGDAVVAKYGFGGSPGWVRVFGRQGSEDKPNAVTPVVAQDGTGIWIAGETQATVGSTGTSAGEFDGFLLQIDGTGNAGDNFNFGTPNTERITGLTVATGGDQPEIYVIGETNGDLVGGRPPAVGFLPFISQVSVGSGGNAQLNGLYYGTPETTASALVRRGDGAVVAIGYHRQTEFLNKTPTGGDDYYVIEHRPFPTCFPNCGSNQ